MCGMRTPIFVRALTEPERERLETGLRSKDAFVLRRCQIILASSRGQRAPAIAEAVGCDDETVRDVIRAFNERGVAALQRRSTRPKHIQAAFSAQQAEQLRELLHRSPREFGKPTSLWTLELAAEVSFAQGLTQTRVSDETIRVTLQRLDVKWKRAKHWITSPDPAYVRKKTPATG
jgi:transposase